MKYLLLTLPLAFLLSCSHAPEKQVSCQDSVREWKGFLTEQRMLSIQKEIKQHSKNKQITFKN